MWDGNDYCKGCVDAVCPGLFEYAVDHDELREEVEFNLRSALLSYLLLWGVMSLFLMCLLVPVGVSRSGLAGIWQGMLAGLALPVLGLWTIPVNLLLLSKSSRSVVAKDGWITFRLPCWGREFKVPIAGTRWSVGRVWDRATDVDYMLRMKVTIWAPARFWGLRLGKHVIICGVTPETRWLWEGFLTLAG